jgi:hypothetical protein
VVISLTGGAHRSDSVSVRPCAMLCTGLTGAGDRSDWSEQDWCIYSVLSSGLHAFVQGEFHWF